MLIPGFFFAAFAAAQGIYSLLGYKPENNDAPLWVDLIAVVVGVAILLLPCVAAVLYGGRATRVGDRWGLVPLVIGAFAGVGFTILSVVSTFFD